MSELKRKAIKDILKKYDPGHGDGYYGCPAIDILALFRPIEDALNERIKELEEVITRSIDFLNAVHPPSGIVEDVIAAFEITLKENNQ